MVISKPTNLRIESILKAFLSDVEASKMELNSFKFHAKANYNSLSADLEKLKSSDVFDDVATLILKVGSEFQPCVLASAKQQYCHGDITTPLLQPFWEETKMEWVRHQPRTRLLPN